MPTDIRCDGVSKRFQISPELASRGAAGSGRRASVMRRGVEFWALRDVSFEVGRGESLGIIGRNGAGKTTLLRLLSRITAPTAGRITIAGRLSALIEIGSGFHPELTGRENVYLNGSILGMRRREITEKLDRIIDFSGVRQFIDTPTKHYSWGMYVRLGFSIAAHLNADIVLLDEVLAVGDAAFQEKCLARLGELRQSGRSVVLISHDLGAVQALSSRVLLLDQGRIVADGAPVEVIERYRRLIAGEDEAGLDAARPGVPIPVDIISVELCDATGLPRERARTGEPLTARIGYCVNGAAPNPMIALGFRSYDGQLHCQLSTEGGPPLVLGPGKGVLEFQCPELGLKPGVYYAEAFVKPDASTWHVASRQRSAMLRVEPGRPQHGQFFMPHTWRSGGKE